ncbi:hypothetical protein FH972_025122 [Carpinus fangiana]|uniref:F-box domain-containing protein n=1 Tax=Carpinus fangiana TaxID=176857 RepID=A0A5N6L2M6_9ROSI|nr:hypothetical protein FH972_025122 [Carpinus fangiana]
MHRTEVTGCEGGHGHSFLCLPTSVRRRIYLEAGLFADCDRICLGEPRDSWPKNSVYARRDCMRYAQSSAVTYNLELTCRTIYREACSILYSTNHFTIQYEQARGLSGLQHLTPSALSSLSRLTVCLNVTQCQNTDPYSKNCDELWHWAKWGRYDETALQSSSSRFKDILRDWEKAAHHLGSHCKPSTLKLYLICDVENAEVAVPILEPLFSMPQLAKCAIRLGQHPDSKLQDLAREAALRATKSTQDILSSPFPFLRLPRELRLHVLSYTDLITPLREVHWNPEKKFYVQYLSWTPDGEYLQSSFSYRQVAPLRCCFLQHMGCFCPRFHASYPEECNCWSPPTPIFLASRALKADAEEIFYRLNRFIITHPGGTTYIPKRTPDRLEGSIFLTDVVPFAHLHHLRFLELVFPPFEDDYIQSREPAYQDWIDTIDRIHTKLIGMTLRVYMRDQGLHYVNNVEIPFRAHSAAKKGEIIPAMYVRTLEPLKKLRGLERFFVHLACPFSRNRDGYLRRDNKRYMRDRYTRDLEDKVEKLVMGPGYDAIAAGKEDLEVSQWREDELVSGTGADQWR